MEPHLALGQEAVAEVNAILDPCEIEAQGLAFPIPGVVDEGAHFAVRAPPIFAPGKETMPSERKPFASVALPSIAASPQSRATPSPFSVRLRNVPPAQFRPPPIAAASKDTVPSARKPSLRQASPAMRAPLQSIAGAFSIQTCRLRRKIVPRWPHWETLCRRKSGSRYRRKRRRRSWRFAGDGPHPARAEIERFGGCLRQQDLALEIAAVE